MAGEPETGQREWAQAIADGLRRTVYLYRACRDPQCQAARLCTCGKHEWRVRTNEPVHWTAERITPIGAAKKGA